MAAHQHAESEKQKEKDPAIQEGVGAISYKALMMAKERVKIGVPLIDVANAVEDFLKKEGYGFAFPLNISINSNAAHYTPTYEDKLAFTDKDVVKLDFGAEKDGILADCALTVDLSQKNQKLVDAVNQSLQNAISTVKAGVMVKDIGKVIANTIESAGFKPIKNLGGHGVKEHSLHDEPFIPNFDNGDETILEENEVIAIEPFGTDGKGMVRDGDTVEIYEYYGVDLPVRSKYSRLILEEIKKNYSHEPFAVRWLSNVVSSRFELYAGISELARANLINPHPVLVEAGNGMVAQAEVTVVVEKGGCRVITK
jgi:methionyl aminopeptidase